MWDDRKPSAALLRIMRAIQVGAFGGIERKRTMKTFITALTLGSLIAVPAFLRSANAAPLIDAARARAIHDCNVAASTYKQYLWGHFESDTYRACMAEHGQQE